MYLIRGLRSTATDREAIAHVRSKFCPEHRRNPQPREARKKIYRLALEQHHRHQQLVRGFRL